MSEQNILNPAATSLLNFDWGYDEGLPELREYFQADSGKEYSRRNIARGRIYNLAWNKRDLATKHALQQWEEQYKGDFFTLADWERGRYFSGRFDGPLSYSPSGNAAYNIRGRFVELPGLVMFNYPANWARDAAFLEERNGFGEDLIKLTGSWSYNSPAANAHGGADYLSNVTNDAAEWLYFGYGFQVWARKNPGHGIMEISQNGAVMGTADLYAAADTAAQAVFSNPNSPLGLYRIKLRVTGTKNGLANNFYICADAIQVMR